MPEQDERFETWAVVEVFGHNTFAGFVTEQTIGGCSLIRVDVPELPAVESEYLYERRPASPAFSKLFGNGAIYSITPCTEELARAVANQKRSAALNIVGLPAARQIETRNDDDQPDFLDEMEAVG